MRYELVEVATEGDWRDYHSLRRQVLWEAGWRTCIWNETELTGIASGTTQMSKDISAPS